MSTDFGLLLTVNGNPVSFGPKEATKGITNMAAWSLLEPKPYKLTKPVEIGSANDLDVFLSTQFGIKQGDKTLKQQIEDNLPSTLDGIVDKLAELILTIEEFEINIPAPAKFRKVAGTYDSKDAVYQASSDSLKSSLLEAKSAISGKNESNSDKSQTATANPFEIIPKENRKTTYKLGLSLQWKAAPISITDTLKVNGVYLKIDSEN